MSAPSAQEHVVSVVSYGEVNLFLTGTGGGFMALCWCGWRQPGDSVGACRRAGDQHLVNPPTERTDPA